MTPNLFQSSIEHLKKNDRRGQAVRKMSSRLHSANIAPSRAQSDSSSGTWKHDAYESLDDDPQNDNNSNNNKNTSSKSDTSPALKIDNLHYEISEEELNSLIQQFGPAIDGPRIHYDKSGRSLGYAFVRFKEEQHAIVAKNRLDGALAKGQNIVVTYDFSRPRGAAAIAAAGPLFHRLKLSPKDLDSSERSQGGIKGRGRGIRGRGARGDFKQRSSFNSRRRGGAGGSDRGRKFSPATTQDLDKQLDDFMGGGNKPTTTTTNASNSNSNGDTAGNTTSATQDVDMS